MKKLLILIVLCILCAGCASQPSDVQPSQQVTQQQAISQPQQPQVQHTLANGVAMPPAIPIAPTTTSPVYKVPIISVPTPEITHIQTETKYASVYSSQGSDKCFEVTTEPEQQYASGSSGIDTRAITAHIRNICQQSVRKEISIQWYAPQNLPSYYGTPISSYNFNPGDSVTIKFTGKHIVTPMWGYLGEQMDWTYKIFIK